MVYFLGQILWRMKDHVHKIQQARIKQRVTHTSTVIPKKGTIHQPLNHFDRKDDKTFPQVQITDMILHLHSSLNVISPGWHKNKKYRYGALLVALEHRFYGQSINPDGLETENLRDLSSQQADIYDTCCFISSISFPHLIYGAVASSAPVQAQLDFSSYNRVVGCSLMNEAVGGSKKCVAEVKGVFAAVEAALLTGNEVEVGKDFGCCETPFKPEDKMELLQSLADIFMGTVQYNEEGVAFSIAELCDIMTNKSEQNKQKEEAYERLVKLAAVTFLNLILSKVPCLDVSHEKLVLELRNTTATSSYRQWFYQTCTEFGFYQTCEDTSCPFSRMSTIQSQTELCSQIFDIPQEHLPVHIDFTNQYYGGNRPQTQRVLYVNGNIDPWTELSVVWNDTMVDNDRVILIDGTAHCMDMNSDKSMDKPALHQARKVKI
uniref:Thymus-specific serine protease n=1 Tax=Sinocyclocheilus anshuiensis TaxID=1608454 RepID=A0A671SXE4_9TELE